MNRYFLHPHRVTLFFTALAILLPFLFALSSLVLQQVLLWYDPARDLLTAWNTLSKPTLIGPPSGIPGLFYGPYWVWLLSIGLLFSKNPVVVTFITATIPYCVIFPIIWFRLNKYFNRSSRLIGWLLFMFSTGLTYATQLWNPYPAPLITTGIIALLISSNFENFDKRQLFLTILTGFLMGMLINFHIAFGIALLLGVILFLITDTYLAFNRNKNKFTNIILKHLTTTGLIALGIFISFLPTLFFESRHGFHQITTLLHTFLKYGAVVPNQGLSKIIILQNFFDTFAGLLHLPTFIAIILLVLILTYFIYSVKVKKIKFEEKDYRILSLLGSLFLGILFIYLTAKNPIWKYHFIGVDILFLFMLAYFSTKISLLRKGLLIIAIYSICLAVLALMQNVQLNRSTLLQQEQAVRMISTDAKNADYRVYAYSPSIYMYEYAYLFRWIAHKEIPYDPGMTESSPQAIYLIVPAQKTSSILDFINNRSQGKKYKKAAIWNSLDGTTIIKNIKISK